MPFCTDNLDSLGRQNCRFESSGCFGYLEAGVKLRIEFLGGFAQKNVENEKMWRFMYHSIPLIGLYLKMLKYFSGTILTFVYITGNF